VRTRADRTGVVETVPSLTAQRDVLLGMLLQQARVMAAQWGTTYDEDACREHIMATATARPGTDPAADRARALGQGVTP
jgi:hypothetical protein